MTDLLIETSLSMLLFLTLAVGLTQLGSMLLTYSLMQLASHWFEQARNAFKLKRAALNDELHLTLMTIEHQTWIKRTFARILEYRLEQLHEHLNTIIAAPVQNSRLDRRKQLLTNAIWELCSIFPAAVNRQIMLKAHWWALGSNLAMALALLALSLTGAGHHLSSTLIRACQIAWPLNVTWTLLLLRGTPVQLVVKAWENAANQCYQLLSNHLPPPLPVERTKSPKKEVSHEINAH